MIALVAIVAYTSIGAFGLPGWWKWDHVTPGDGRERRHPDAEPAHAGWAAAGFAIGDHPFGQDEIGRDIFARVMKGTQTSLNVMVVISVLAALIGMAIGAVAGYFRGCDRPVPDALHRPVHHLPGHRHRRRARQARRLRPAPSGWPSRSGASAGPRWRGSCVASSSPCENASSSTRPRWPGRAASASSAST